MWTLKGLESIRENKYQHIMSYKFKSFMFGSMLVLTMLLDVGTVWKWVANILGELAATTF